MGRCKGKEMEDRKLKIAMLGADVILGTKNF